MDTAEMVLRAVGGLAAVLGTLWVAVRVARARAVGAGTAPVARLRVIARASVGRHASVVTVDAGDRVLVLGVADSGVRLLAEQPALPAPEPAVERVDLDLGSLPGVVPGAGPSPVPAPRSALTGSLVDPGTWRQAVAAVRERTVRR